jgi:hypothetical protein
MIEKTNWILSTFHQLLVGWKCNDLVRLVPLNLRLLGPTGFIDARNA